MRSVHGETPPAMVPELDVTDVAASTAFYALLGFAPCSARPDEGFAYLVRDGAHLMLQTADGPGRRFRTAPLVRPFGRGVNHQLEVEDVRAVHRAVRAAGHPLVVDLEERWYRAGDHEAGNLQFVVEDPDGHLWRPFEDLGTRPAMPWGTRHDGC
jgi:catechol 2,3-dioxygenase-like lactoylglutathione lyase family enzyme